MTNQDLILTESKNSSAFTPPSEGTHPARCFAVVNVGVQKTKFGEKTVLWIGWEIAGHRNTPEIDGDKLDLPATVWNSYNFSNSPNSNLRIDLTSWRGRDFTPEELKGFDITSIVVAPCLLGIVHNATPSRTYANVQSVMKVMSDTVVPELENEEIRYSPTSAGDFELLPKFLQDMVRKAPRQAPPIANTPPDDGDNGNGDFEDDAIPF